MKAQIKFGHIRGIEIGLHYSWLIIAVLITVGLAGHFHEVNPDWGEIVIWSSAVITGLLFFFFILVHELSHALVAGMRGARVKAITLFALGGVAQIEKDVSDATTEFWMAIAGPITSALIGLLCLGAALGLGWQRALNPSTPLQAVLVWLGYINLALAAFNMIPGFPLDGGRVLRALLWWWTKDAERATRWAAGVGQVIAVLFIAYGLAGVLLGRGLNGLWMAVIGWFLLEAARASVLQVELAQRLKGIKTGDVMARDYDTVEGSASLEELAHLLLRTGRRCFVVKRDGFLQGLITAVDVGKLPREEWASTSVQAAMRPLRELRTVGPDTPLMQALEIMGTEDLNQLPVVSDGELLGLISRGHILQVLQAKADLKV